MGFIARSHDTAPPFTEAIALEALERVGPAALIEAAAASADVPSTRRRKLPRDVTLLLCLAMSLWTQHALDVVLHKMVHGRRLFWPDPDLALATTGALGPARSRLGARPVVALYHRVCRPLATPQTPGAFLWGVRLMAIDGATEDVPDAPAIGRALGRQHAERGDSAFPQVQGVSLSECGTHAVVDAGFWPWRVSERVGAVRLLRRVGTGMLLLLERGFYRYEMIERTRARGAHVLARVPSTVTVRVRHRLPDGSYWAYSYPSDPPRKKRGDHLLVRVIVYTLTDPTRPGYGETHRLVTTLLDAQQTPALDLICADHTRWESALTIDEIDTHQRLVPQPLRSRKPVGVIQERDGLLLAPYAVRALMAAAAAAALLAPTRLSFVQALELIRVAIDDCHLVAPAQHDLLYQRLLRDIAAGRLPERAKRTNPRVVTRKMSKFKLKRDVPPPASQHLVAFAATILVLPQDAPAQHALDGPALDEPVDTTWLLPCLI